MLNHVTDIRFMYVQHIIIFIIIFCCYIYLGPPWEKFMSFLHYMKKKKKKKKKKPFVK
jgi:hypothetical protein